MSPSPPRVWDDRRRRQCEALSTATAQLAATVRLGSVSQADFDTVFYPECPQARSVIHGIDYPATGC
jgi:hypothetical protein